MKLFLREINCSDNKKLLNMVDKKGRIYGETNIRHKLNESLLIHGGNIGYLIRQRERKTFWGIDVKFSFRKMQVIGIN